MSKHVPRGADVPELVVKTQGSERSLHPGPSYSLGRDPQCDIAISDSRVSWHHADLHLDRDSWILEDAGSTNGIYLGSHRQQRIEIDEDCVLRLGDPDTGPVVSCELSGVEAPARADGGRSPAGQPVPAPPGPPAPGGPDGSALPGLSGTGALRAGRPPTAVMRVPAQVMRIGRAPDNDLVVPDLGVSRHHAELRNLGGRYEIVDLGSHNGTFVNGQRVSSAPMTERDVVAIGRATFRLVGDELREFIDEGDVSLTVQDLTVRISGGKVLLDHVSFPIGERCLVGIIGPSGAGKTTLLGALTGIRPADEGAVLYDDRDLYAFYPELRHRIGLVPQENILHTQLSARRALRYAAELRFPGDTSPDERNRRVDEVLAELGLTAHAQTRAGSLSGGQQKRVNVALELLTKPSLLFLDEPTSGLDPGLDKSVMEMMSGLAKDGRTVIVVTHSVANLDVCDRLLVLVPGGRLAFYGPPDEGLRYFGKNGWAEVFQAFDGEPDRDWAADFQRSPWYEQYVSTGVASGVAEETPEPPEAPPAPRSWWAQLSTLTRRYLAVIASDRNYLAVLAIMPIAVGLLIRAVPASEGLGGKPGTNADAASLLLILIIGACFVGSANSVRELVKERAIYRRERAAGLSVGAYLSSKLVVLGLISGLQAFLLVVLGLTGRPLPSHGAFLKSAPYLELVLAIVLLSIASMALGLLVSAAVSTSEKTMPLLVLLAMAQVILSGGVLPLNGKAGLNQLSWLAPSRWGFSATASTVSLTKISPPAPHTTADPLWAHKPGVWLLDMGLMILLAVVFTTIAWFRLLRLSPGRRRG